MLIASTTEHWHDEDEVRLSFIEGPWAWFSHSPARRKRDLDYR